MAQVEKLLGCQGSAPWVHTKFSEVVPDTAIGSQDTVRSSMDTGVKKDKLILRNNVADHVDRSHNPRVVGTSLGVPWRDGIRAGAGIC